MEWKRLMKCFDFTKEKYNCDKKTRADNNQNEEHIY